MYIAEHSSCIHRGFFGLYNLIYIVYYGHLHYSLLYMLILPQQAYIRRLTDLLLSKTGTNWILCFWDIWSNVAVQEPSTLYLS